MGRPMTIVTLVVLFMASGVASADDADEVRLPITVGAEQAAAETVVVEKGDHLWKISARHLHNQNPDQPVAPYWRVVVDTNTPGLRSGDPDLIYPGETIELPEISEQP